MNVQHSETQHTGGAFLFANRKLIHYRNAPNTDRQVVKEKLMELREKFQNNEAINCYYVTNNFVDEWEQEQIKVTLKNLHKEYHNLKIHILNQESIVEVFEIKKGQLPKDFRNREIGFKLARHFEVDETIVAMVNIKDFAEFVKDGGNTLFHSNIRNYLNNTKINSGIKNTLQEKREEFWYYNNGVTIVCDEFTSIKQYLKLKAPQIVNGCQTAKSISTFFADKTRKEIEQENANGHLLVKIIRTKRSASDGEKQMLRENITRYTNSQNAVRGLDFYAFDRFQRDMQGKFEKLGYYYEIQRGAFITLDKVTQKSFSGLQEYNYLLEKLDGKKKYVLPH